MIQLHYNNQPIPLDEDGTYTTLITNVLEDLHMDLGIIDHAGEEHPDLDCTPQGINNTLKLLRLANPDLNVQWRINA